jgi:hypothetical protein
MDRLGNADHFRYFQPHQMRGNWMRDPALAGKSSDISLRRVQAEYWSVEGQMASDEEAMASRGSHRITASSRGTQSHAVAMTATNRASRAAVR